MTTNAAADATLVRFNKKSPRDAYKQVCQELEIPYQRDIYNKLPEVPSAWHRIRTLELDGSLLGPKGCMALLPIILVSNTLRKITLKNVGLSDQFVLELCNILQGHPAVRSVDISDNELVSVFCASAIISLMKNNCNMVDFLTEGTHIGDNIGNIIAKMGAHNRFLLSTYYTDNYFKLKNMFGYLDENGEGWVGIKTLIMNCPYPILQEQFVERIAKVKPRKKSNNTISVDSFMSLVYMNYKTEGEIMQYSKQELEPMYIFLVSNWKQILSAVERYNEENEVKVVLPDDLHRMRVRDLLVTNEDADSIISAAVTLVQSEDDNGGDVVKLTSNALLQASKSVLPPREEFHYQFFEDRPPDYVPEVMRNGSRLFDMNQLANMDTGSRGSAASLDPVCADDLPHTWHLPVCLVKLAVDYFNEVVRKMPKKKKSNPGAPSPVSSPRTQKDKAMERPAIPIESLIAVTFETDFEILKCPLLANFYSYYSLPVQDSTITLQEMLNLLDELYVQIGVDKIISNEQIEAMTNPFEVPEYADFLARYLFGREAE